MIVWTVFTGSINFVLKNSNNYVFPENFEVTPQAELTPNGFINLNLMEARDPQGGPDELWVTLESMGYSRKLQLTMVCLYTFAVCKLSMLMHYIYTCFLKLHVV